MAYDVKKDNAKKLKAMMNESGLTKEQIISNAFLFYFRKNDDAIQNALYCYFNHMTPRRRK